MYVGLSLLYLTLWSLRYGEVDRPDMLASHPHYKRVHDADGFFHNPHTGKSVEVRIWSSGVGTTAPGGWSDLTSNEGRAWWGDGVKSLIDLGVDGMWK